MVLRLAYPVGNLFSDVFLGNNDGPWRGALGFSGPTPPVKPPVFGDPIPGKPPPAACEYGHHDYLPPDDPILVPPGPGGPVPAKWWNAAGYMLRAISGAPNHWQ
jgi:hypothetical protein